MRSLMMDFLRIITLLFLTIFINACTNSNEKSTTAVIGREGTSTQTSTVTYVQGTFGAYSAKTVGAECILSSPEKPNIVTRVTDANGFVNFDTVVIPKGIVTLTCSGGSYVDEATGNTISPSPTIHASMNYTSGPLIMVATPLSEIAYRLAVENNDTSNIDNYNKDVAKSFGLETTNLVAIKPIDLNDKAADDTQEGKVGLILAAISQMAKSTSASDAQSVIKKLTLDLGDGKLDEPENNISKAFTALTTSSNSKVAENIVSSEAITNKIVQNEQKQKSLLVTGISINGVNEVLIGTSITLRATAEPAIATERNVSWSLNDISLATISNSGVLHALSSGVVVVKASAKDGSGVQSTKSITIHEEYSDVDYGIQSYEYGDKLQTLVFSNLGTGITNCTSTPSLPKGFLLSLNANAMCQLEGEAAVISTKTRYKIVANGTKSSATFTVDIKAKPITVKADTQQSKIYGTQDSNLTYSISPALFYDDTLSGSMHRKVGEDVGSYMITQGTLANSNYIISFKDANFSILPKPITVTADIGAAKVYGEIEPQLTYSISPNLLPDEALSGVLSREAGENVGSYAITQGTLSNPNYEINFVKDNFQITPKPITITANKGQSKMYGATDPILTYTTSIASEGFQGVLSRDAGEKIGTYTITQGTLSNPNYTISFQPAIFTITMPKKATALINKLKSKLTTVKNTSIVKDANGVMGVKFTTQLLGEETTAIAFDINGTNDFAFVATISAPLDKMMCIADDAWIKDPSAVDKQSTTRKLDIYDLGFTKEKIFVYASNTLSLDAMQMPNEVQTLLKGIYGDNFKLKVSKGLSLHNKIDMNNIPEMRSTLKFLVSTDEQWGKSGTNAYDATARVNIPLNNSVTDITRKAVLPSFKFHASVNAFNLQFGKFIRFNVLGLNKPLNVQPVLNVSRDKSSFTVSLSDADVEMPIFNKSVNSNLDVSLKTASIQSKEKRVSINILNNKDFPLFGANWLTFGPKGYGMHVEVPPIDAALTIKYLAQTKLLGKFITFQSNQLLLGGASGAAVATLLSPPTVGFTIHDGPGKIGELPLNFLATLYAYMLETSGAKIDHNSFGNTAYALKLVGILPKGETIESEEKKLGHPIGVSFEIFPDVTSGLGISGVDFSAGLQLFDIKKSLAEVRKFTVSKGTGIYVDASTTDFTLGDGSLFTMPNFTINVTVPGIKDIVGGADISVDENGTFGRNVINLIEGNAVGLAKAYNDIEIKLIGKAKILTADTNLTYTITPWTQKSDFLMKFAGMDVNSKLYSSVQPWDPGMDYEMDFDTKQLSASANTGAAKMREQIGNMFSDINSGITDIQKAINKAQKDLDRAKADYNTIKAQAQKNKDKAEKPIRDAEAKVKAAKNNLKSYDYDWYYKYSSHWSNCYDTLLGEVCTTPPERWAAYAPWKAGRGVYLGALSVAEGVLWTTRQTVTVYPVDSYPEVIAAAANVDLAKQNLAAANDLATSYKAISNGLQDALKYATNVVDQFFQLVSFKVYGGFGLNSIIGIAADTVILGKKYTFDVGAGSDLTYLRDNFIAIINKEIWQPISEMIANDSVSKQSAKIYATQNITNHAPTGTIPDKELLQDNSKECNTTNACYTLDISQYISDIDTAKSKLKFRAIGLPQHMRMDKHGVIIGALSRNDIGIHLVKVNVSDDTFMSFDTSFHLKVTGVNSQHSIEVLTTHKEIDSQEFNSSTTNALSSTFATIRGNSKAVDYSKLAQVVVQDPDVGDTYKYEIIAGNDAGHFSINNQGYISLNPKAEGNIQNNYNLSIRVTDNSTYAPKHLKAETDFAIDVKPTIWLESSKTIDSEYPRFLVHIYPKPSPNNTNQYTVSYRVENIKLPTDAQDVNNTTVSSTVLQRERQSGGIYYAWNDTKMLFLNEAKTNRQIDRQYRIKLLNVDGDAYIDKSRDTLNANVYASAKSVKLAPLNETPSRFTKLDLNGIALADDATDWACVRDDLTGLMWTSRSRIKQHLPTDAYHPTGWDGSSYSSQYGYNLLYASFGEHSADKKTRLLNNKIMSMQGYCGSQDVNIPTVTELQSIIDYSKSAKMVNEVYFPNLDFTKPYLALKVDSYNKRRVYDSTNEYANVNTWQMNAWYALPNIQHYDYLEALGNNNSGYINFPLQDTPVDLVYAYAQRQTLLNKALATINLDTGSVGVVQTNYVYNASYNNSSNGNIPLGQIAPYFNGELMYVIYPKIAGQVNPYVRKNDGAKDEDFSYIIRTLFSSEIFVVLN